MLARVQEHSIHRNGRPVAGFGLGSMLLPAWVAARNKLQDMDRLIASGRGDELVDGGNCTEPGGGIAADADGAAALGRGINRRERKDHREEKAHR